MKDRKTAIKIVISFVLVGTLIVFLYYYFFVKLEGDWMFWKGEGEDIEWSNVEYEDFVLDTEVETFGEYGEWKMKEMNPVYAGYDTTEDGINYIIGKYLDEEGKEQTVKILVSGEGVVDYPYPDTEYEYIFDNVYKDSVPVKRAEITDIIEDEDPEYSSEDSFVGIESYELSMVPDALVLTREELIEIFKNGEPTTTEANYYTEAEVLANGYEIVSEEEYEEITNSSDDFSDLTYSYYMSYDLFEEYYNPTYIFDFLDYLDFESLVTELEIGDQIGVLYLETEKSFEDCKYDVNGVYKVFCANAFLNETYDNFVVGIYVVIEDSE